MDRTRSRGVSYSSAPRAGVTLVEMLVVIIIISLVVAGVSRMMSSSWASRGATEDQNNVQKEAAAATDTIVDHLRGASEVLTGTAAELTARFADGSTVRYYRVGSQVRRDRYNGTTGVTTTGEVICRVADALQLSYARRYNNVLVVAAPAAAESVVVSVRTAEEGYQATETSVVRLRNKY